MNRLIEIVSYLGIAVACWLVWYLELWGWVWPLTRSVVPLYGVALIMRRWFFPTEKYRSGPKAFVLGWLLIVIGLGMIVIEILLRAR